jgi:hypothetical protein
MSDAKSLIIAEVLLQERKPFRMSAIVKGTGLRSSHVDYHLKRLVDTGSIEKQGPVYLIVNTEQLIDSLINSRVVEGPAPQYLNKFPFKSLEKLHLPAIRLGRAIGLPESLEIRTALVEDIDNSIKALKEVRKRLTNDHLDSNSARKRLKEKGKQKQLEKDYLEIGELLKFSLDKDKIVNDIDDFVWRTEDV